MASNWESIKSAVDSFNYFFPFLSPPPPLSLSAPTLYSLSIALLINSTGRFFSLGESFSSVAGTMPGTFLPENSACCSLAREYTPRSSRVLGASRAIFFFPFFFFPLSPLLSSPSFVFSPRVGLAHARHTKTRMRARTQTHTHTRGDKVWLRIFAYAKEQIRCARLRMPRVRTGSKSDIVCEHRACSKRVCV